MTLQLPHHGEARFDRPVVMGILNVTPDSFSDGGRYTDVGVAAAHAEAMCGQGAGVIDIGGESTRPGSDRVDAQEQIGRVVPVIERLCRQVAGVVVSVDTTRSVVAEAALSAGAAVINDVSAGRDDPRVFEVAARWGAPVVLMHMRGTPRTMQLDPRYEDVVGEVEAFLVERAAAAVAAGVGRSQILIDPGIGFGKTTEHNVALLADLERLVGLGYPVVLGASRKRFLRELCGLVGGVRAEDLASATCATTVLGVQAGVAVFRVHDVQANRRAADVAWAVGQRVSGGR